MEVLMRKTLFFLLLTALFPVLVFGMTEDEAVSAIQEYFQCGKPDKAIGIAHTFKDKNPELKKLAFIAAVKSGNIKYASRLLPFDQTDGELNYYIGSYYEKQGELDKAIDAYISVQKENMFASASCFAAGRCAEKLGELTKAEIYYDMAMAKEHTYFAAKPALARVKEKLGKKKDAEKVLSGKYTTLSKGDSTFAPPQFKKAKVLPADFVGKKSGRIVRACLGEGVTSVTVTLSSTNEVFDIYYENGSIYINNKSKLVENNGKSYRITNKNGKGTVKLSNIKTAGKYVNIVDGSMFRGEIEFLIKGNALMLINHIDLEEYLYGVVPSEMFASWPDEALKAQAVAARSFILLKMQGYVSREYDVYVGKDTAYRGFNREKNQTTAAVDETYGIALFTPRGTPMDALFCTNCGGYTSTTATAWGSRNTGNLAAVPDKKIKKNTSSPSAGEIAKFIKNPPDMYCYMAPYAAYSTFRWCTQLTREELEEMIDPSHTMGYIKGIQVNSRDIGGRVTSLTVQGTLGVFVLGTQEIRAKLGGLKSSLFICEYQLSKSGLPEVFTFIGGGWGHGIGLCQTGACGMAVSGIGFREILSHYYPEAVLKENCY